MPSMSADSRHSPRRRGQALSAEQVRRVYDRIGRLQDSQAFYEDAAIDDLIAHGDFEHAHRVIEIGCGTGRLARRLLDRHLPSDATYLGVDLSARMVAITRSRIEPYASRCSVDLVDATTTWPPVAGAADRVVATYVFELLDPTATGILLTRIRDALAPGGLVCVASLTHGRDGVARAVSSVWTALWRYRPSLVGGCRPVALAERLGEAGWETTHPRALTRWGFTSEIIVARPSPS